jgi:hypothetical protein
LTKLFNPVKPKKERRKSGWVARLLVNVGRRRGKTFGCKEGRDESWRRKRS